MDSNKNVTKSLFSPNLKLSFLNSQQKTSPSQENKKINLITEFFRTKIQRNISSDQKSRQKQKKNKEKHIEITPFFVPTKKPTEAYNRWHNEEKGSLIFGDEYKSIEKEDELIKPQSFRPFTDYLEHNNNSWKERFQSENSMIGLYEKQLNYNKENKIILEKKSSDQQLNSFRNMFKEIDEYQIKIKRLPPVRNRKINQKIIQLDDNLNSSIVSDTSEKDNNYKLKGFWSINQNSLWKPGSREGATILLYENKLYLYGGLSNQVHSELCQLDLNGLYLIFFYIKIYNI